MTALTISDIRNFMRQLFALETFDRFRLEEAVIKTYVTFTIDGGYEPGFFRNEDQTEGEGDKTEQPEEVPYVSWGKIRPAVFDLIKGKNTPLFMKLVLHADPARFPDLPEAENITALLLMVRFDASGLLLTTGVNQRTFSMSRESDAFWDETVRRALTKAGISYEQA